MMPRNAAQYTAMLQALLPRGLAWACAVGSRLRGLLAGSAEELARVDAAAVRLYDDVNPLSTVSGLADWERVLGLPSACQLGGTTLQERRAAVFARLSDTGRQDTAYYEELAALMGYRVTVTVYRPFVAGRSRCGDRLYAGGYVRHVWRVTVHGARLTRFCTGASRCGDTLLKISKAHDLECLLRTLKQAHTVLVFAYE